MADYLPGGKLWTAKNIADKTMRNLLVGLSRESLRAEGYLKALQDQFIPDMTDNFIPDWERALGIPDDCFPGTGSNDIRRRDILVKLASLGVQTAEDFENLAALFGITANVLPGASLIEFPLTFPVTFVDDKFTIVVEFVNPDAFPFTFPITFGGDSDYHFRMPF